MGQSMEVYFFGNFKAIRTNSSMLYMVSKRKTLGKYYYCMYSENSVVL